MQIAMEKLNLISLNKQKDSSEGDLKKNEDSNMLDFISCSGTVAQDRRKPIIISLDICLISKSFKLASC